MALEFACQAHGLVRRSIPDAGEQSGLMKIACHVHTHGTQADETRLHTRSSNDFSKNA
jgi:hypothetical protein